MGKLLLAEVANNNCCRLAAAASRGDDAKSAMQNADVAIDFTTPDASVAHAELAAALSKPLVIGTTGLCDAQMQILHRAAAKAPIFYARNFSLGIFVLQDLVSRAAQYLPADYHIEITETHHTRKKDAPSGTALILAEAIRAARPSANPDIQSHREGDVIGDHFVNLGNSSESLTLGHRALDRRVFAEGAVQAALWLVGQNPGFYGMKDLISGMGNGE